MIGPKSLSYGLFFVGSFRSLGLNELVHLVIVVPWLSLARLMVIHQSYRLTRPPAFVAAHY